MSKEREVREREQSLVNTFKILVAFSLSKRKINASKGEVDDGRRDHGDEGPKSMKMEGSEHMSGEFS